MRSLRNAVKKLNGVLPVVEALWAGHDLAIHVLGSISLAYGSHQPLAQAHSGFWLTRHFLSVKNAKN